MAGTDDVARDVADLLVNQGLKAANMATDIAPRIVKGLGDVSSVKFSKMLDEMRKNKELKKMMGMEGDIDLSQMTEIARRFGEQSSSISIHDDDVKDFDKILKDQGVLYSKLDNKTDNYHMYVFLNKDVEKVQNATVILQSQRGKVTELNPKLYFNSLSPDKVHAVEGLSDVEMELFRHYAREQGLLFTSIPRKEGNIVVCNVEDAQKARRALLYTGWALTGANGARVREQVERRLAGRTAINIAAEEGERELYIMSQTNPSRYVHISAEDFAVYKQNKQVSTVSRSDPDFYAKCISACEGMPHPVVMSAEQYNAGITPQDLEHAHTIDLFPEVHDDMVQMDQANRLANLVAMKAGLDNDHNATWGLWDPSVSYSEFAAYEYISDEDERDARAYEFEHFKQAAFYSKNNHSTYDVDMKEKSLDYIIDKAEEKRRQQSGEPSRQHESSHRGMSF